MKRLSRVTGCLAAARSAYLLLGRRLALKRTMYIFWNSETKTHIKGIKKAWATACSRAKIIGVRFHDCRHTALTWMLQSGADIVSVSKIAGHASIVMTQRYCHASPELQRLAVNRVSEILEQARQKVDTPSSVIVEPLHLTPSKIYL